MTRQRDYFRQRLWTAALALGIFLLNAFVARPLFLTEYVRHMFSIEAAYIALTRYALENWGALTWFPLWNAGMPYQNAYQPGLPICAAAVAKLLGISPALGYHVALGLFYCAGAVGVFLLVYNITGRRDLAFLAALFFSLLSPSAFLVPIVRRDMGSFWYARRYQALIFYGEGPNVSGLSMVPFALWGVHAVYTRLTAWRFTLAALALGAVILLSWPAGVVMGAGIAAYLLAHDINAAKARIVRLAALALAAYALVAPWDPPSTIRDNERNSQIIGGPYHYTAKHLLFFAVLALATVAIRWLLRSARAPVFVQFSVLWALFPGSVALSAYWANVALLPQPERFHLGMEFGLCFLLASGVLGLASLRGARLYYALFALLLCVSFFQAKRYRRFSDRLTHPLDITGTLEYQTSRWFADHLPGQRIFATGSTAFWLNAWSDTPQVTGCCLPGMPNPISWIVGYAVPSGDGAGSHDAEYALLWMRAFGAQAVAIGGAGTRDSYQDWRNGNKFEGILPKVRESGADRIYRIPSRTTSLAHVVQPGEIVARTPVNGLDVEPLRPFVHALEDPARPLAQWKRISRSEATITANPQAGQVLSIQVTYSPGWHASVAGRSVPIAHDGLGLMTIDPRCTGPCVVSMVFDGGPEAKILRGTCWATAAVLLAWMLFECREWWRTSSAVAVLLEREGDVDRRALLQFCAAFREVKSFEPNGAAVLAQRNAHMLLFHQMKRARHLHSQSREHGLRILRAKGLQHLEILEKAVVQLRERDKRVDLERGLAVGGSQHCAGVRVEPLAERTHIPSAHGQSRSMAVSAIFRKQFRHGIQRIQQMEARDAAPGALRQAILLAQNESGPVKALHQTARHDAEHAAMPAFRAKYQGEMRIAHWREQALFENRLHHCGFFGLARAVQLM